MWEIVVIVPVCNIDGYPVKCCKQTPAISVINKFRRSHWVNKCRGLPYKSKSGMLIENRDFFIPHLRSKPPLRGPHRNFPIIFRNQKLVWWGYRKVKKFEDTFNRLDTIHDRDKRTPRHGIGRALA